MEKEEEWAVRGELERKARECEKEENNGLGTAGMKNEGDA